MKKELNIIYGAHKPPVRVSCSASPYALIWQWTQMNFEMLLTVLCINMTINWLDLIHQHNSKMIFVENSSEWYISLMQLMYWCTANDISCGVDVVMHTAIPSLIAALDTWLVIDVSVFTDPKNMTKLYRYTYIYMNVWISDWTNLS